METKIYNQAGEAVGKFELPVKVFGLPWNGDLVHQVVTAMQSNARQGNADAKGRGEVRGGGKKPWRQKGTGRSRHGSIRSPLWRGGGVTHGPTSERNYERKINKKMKAKAFQTILAQKFRDGEIILLDKLHFSGVKTKSARTMLEKLSQVEGLKTIAYEKGNRALVSLAAPDPVAVKSFRNLGSVAINEDRNLNPLDLINYRYVIIPEPAKNLLTNHDQK